jgi:radical SAM protein with 4Fe4S-binding SPASM domain
MHVILTDNPADRGERLVAVARPHQDCACDCQCACPTDGPPIPVLSSPSAYYVELTPACNNHCPGCGNVYAAGRASLSGFNRSTAPLNGEQWCDLIARLAPHAQQLKLTGGEATLHPAFATIVHAIEEQGIPFTLFTNGRWSQPDKLTRLLRETHTCEGLLVSLHGPDAATHETFSGVPGSFDETITNVRRATDAGLDVATSIVINRHNWNRIAETLTLATGLGANHVVCNRFIGAPLEGVTPSPPQLRAAMATIASLRAQGRPIRFGNCIPQCFQPSSSSGCTAGSTFATIDPWGRLRPCNHAPLVAGDLRTHAVEQIWHSPLMARWRALPPLDCAPCPAFATCHGGCRAQALLAGQDQDPLIQTPLVEPLPSPQAELLLYAGLRLHGQFVWRPEKDPSVLLHKGQVLTVPTGYDHLLPKLDGSLTLRQIEGQFGPAAVDWVGTLYRAGMVSWAREQICHPPHL